MGYSSVDITPGKYSLYFNNVANGTDANWFAYRRPFPPREDQNQIGVPAVVQDLTNPQGVKPIRVFNLGTPPVNKTYVVGGMVFSWDFCYCNAFLENQTAAQGFLTNIANGDLASQAAMVIVVFFHYRNAYSRQLAYGGWLLNQTSAVLTPYNDVLVHRSGIVQAGVGFHNHFSGEVKLGTERELQINDFIMLVVMTVPTAFSENAQPIHGSVDITMFLKG
jgi:hypothetical protein